MPLTCEFAEGERPDTLASVEGWYLMHVLIHTQWKIMKAAEVLGVHRNTVRRMMQRHKIRRTYTITPTPMTDAPPPPDKLDETVTEWRPTQETTVRGAEPPVPQPARVGGREES